MAARESLFKNCIIRIDYSGLVNSLSVITALAESDWFKEAFDKYSREDRDEMMAVHRFSWEHRNEQRELNITSDYCVLNMAREELFKNGDSPAAFFARVIDIIKRSSTYFNFTRIGVRKVYGKDCKFDEADDYFMYFDQKLLKKDDYMCERNYTDTFSMPGKDFFVCYKRYVRDLPNDIFRFVIDIDVYNENPSDAQLAKKGINNYLVEMEQTIPELYNRSVKKKYAY